MTTAKHAEVIAAMQRMGSPLTSADMEFTPAPEPGQPRGEVIETEDVGVPMITTETLSAGYVYIWDSRSGQRSQASVNMLPALLTKKRDDGSRIFSTADPHIPQVQGSCKCLLHEDDPNRALYRSWGFNSCRKANLASRFEVENHMKSRHKREWAAIQSEKERLDKEEQQAFQKAWMAAQLDKPEPAKKAS